MMLRQLNKLGWCVETPKLRLIALGVASLTLWACNGAGYEGPVLKEIKPDLFEVFESETVTYTAVVRDVPGITYQWYQKVPEGINDVPGEKRQNYTITYKLGETIEYIGVSVKTLYDGVEAGNTRPIKIKPKPVTLAKPLPSTVLVTRGNGFIQTAELNYATAPITYQWNKNGQPIAGQVSATLSLPSLTLADNGAQITLSTNNPAGSFTSNVLTLTVQ
jgi:hypothetical protein